MKKSVIFILVWLLFTQAVYAETTLDAYIREGLTESLTIKDHELRLEQSDVAVTEAWGRLLPVVTLHSRYTRFNEGREIEIPVSDMLNPIYEGLNLLTPGAPYPTEIEDEILTLMPETDQETKITVQLPLVMPRLYHGIGLRKEIKLTEEWELAAARRRLVGNIKTAYFSYLKAFNLVQVYEEMEGFLKENLRVSEKLVDSGRSTEDAVYRSQAELADMAQKKLAAAKAQQNAASYLNYLVRRPLDEPVAAVDPEDFNFQPTVGLAEAVSRALASREEIRLLETGMSIEEISRKMALSGNIPELSTAFDYGFQGEDYSFSEDDRFWSISIVGSWNVFNGLQNRSRAEKAGKQVQRLALQLTELKERIRLEVKEAHNNLLVAQEVIAAAVEQETSSRKTYEIVAKKYEEGIVAQVEFLDAQTRLTNASTASLTARYDYLLQYARFEAVACLYDLRTTR